MGDHPVSVLRQTAVMQLKLQMRGVLWDAFSDDKTVEIMVNPDGRIFYEQLGKDVQEIGKADPAVVSSIIRIVSGFHDQVVDADHPICEGEFPVDGSRFEGLMPPVVAGPSFTLRKKAIMVFTLDDYVKGGTMTPRQEQIIREAVRSRRNILVVGGTGSGKTTLINAIIKEMSDQNPRERVVIIEDTGELQCEARNFVQMRSTEEVSMARLLRATLRYRPDRILVGEVRGPEAMDLLDAWNTGHPGGCATLHSDTAEKGLKRLNSLVSRNPSAPRNIEPLIGESVQMVINIAKDPISHKRVIRDIIEVEDYDEQARKYIFHHVK